MTDTKSDTEISKLSFEQALGELDKIVSELESGKAPLEESIQHYERGMKLKSHCEKKLNDAQEKIEKIVVQPDGSVKTEAFEE
ncbi:MAG: exodeoxyribonuclease VII small subunit [Pseudomonadota bacterium]